MKRDIRKLLENTKDSGVKLPENHRKEFFEKLNARQKKRGFKFMFLRSVAVLVLGLAISFGVFYSQDTKEDISPLLAQLETVEIEYLKEIETEWNSFVALAKDEALVARFRKRLKDLDSEYQKVAIQFEDDSNNIIVLEALITNLQTRLQILKDIQNHINLLNQKNEQHESSI